MKHSVIALRQFNHKGIIFFPGDEFDILAFGQNNIDFRALVHSKMIGYGNYGRSFEEVIESSNAYFDEKENKIKFKGFENTKAESKEDDEIKEEKEFSDSETKNTKEESRSRNRR